jgi:hypothetical protein
MNSAADLENLIANWRVLSLTKAELVVLAANAMIGWPYAWGATGQKCTVPNREARIRNPKIAEGDIKLIKKRCQVLNGSAGGCAGCKYYPGNNTTLIFDCIGFVNRVLDIAGVSHYGGGCSTMWNHAANWEAKGVIADLPEMVCLVFQQVKNQPNRMDHIGIYIGDGLVIHCSVEVKIEPVEKYPWTHWALPIGLEGDVPVPTVKPTIRRSSTGPYVAECQQKLVKLGYDLSPYGADGKFGRKTEDAVKAFQTDHRLKADGIVGKDTWAVLDAATDGEPEPAPKETLYTVTIRHLTQGTAEMLCTAYGGEKVAE